MTFCSDVVVTVVQSRMFYRGSLVERVLSCGPKLNVLKGLSGGKCVLSSGPKLNILKGISGGTHVLSCGP